MHLCLFLSLCFVFAFSHVKQQLLVIFSFLFENCDCIVGWKLRSILVLLYTLQLQSTILSYSSFAACRIMNVQIGETSRLAWLGIEADPLVQSDNLMKAYSRAPEANGSNQGSNWLISKNTIVSGLGFLGFHEVLMLIPLMMLLSLGGNVLSGKKWLHNCPINIQLCNHK